MAAFGLEPTASYAALLAVPRNGLLERAARATRSPRSSTAGASGTSRPRGATAPPSSWERRASDDVLVAGPTTSSRPSRSPGSASAGPRRGAALGRSLLEARAALDAASGDVASYRDLGSLELLLGLPDAALEAFVDRVLGPAARERAG